MPSLAFGLKTAKPSNGPVKPPQKRKAVFDEADDDESPAPPQTGAKKSSKPLKPLQPLKDDSSDSESERPAKSPKLTHSGTSFGLQRKSEGSKPAEDKYSNLSALRSAKLQDKAASAVDSSVYDYDGVYDTFRPATTGKTKENEPSGPKYMTSLLASTTQRKRDHERAREKAIQREREAEGDEFADKEAFVTSAYKKAQEETRLAEEEEKRRMEEEEERRKQGVGMMDFNKQMLAREEERMKAIADAEAQNKDKARTEADDKHEEDDDADRKARNLNSKGAKIALNEEGEIIDKRQLLTAGLNVAPKKPGKAKPATNKAADIRAQDNRPKISGDSRAAQRERQSRMIERQMEAMAEKQQAEEAAEEKERQTANQSKITDEAKMGAKERYLARKKEREEEARKAKEGKGG